MSDTEDFEEQLRQEAIQKAKEEAGAGAETYKDKDGMEYEWDTQKQAWFPKIDEDFIAKYQMSYGTSSTEADSTTTPTGSTKAERASEPSQSVPTYAAEAYTDYYKYYQTCYTTAGTTGDSTTTTASTDGNRSLTAPWTSEELPERTQEYIDYCKDYYRFYHGQLNEQKDFDYCAYYEYYSQFTGTGDENAGEEAGGSKESKEQETKGGPNDAAENDKDNNGEKADDDKDKNEVKTGVKRKKEEATWFEMDQEKNTNVYISGLPSDYTDQEFIDLMSKYGMIMYDPFTRKPKAKLYKDAEGNNKGDGRCCFIKVESVDLALKILDGSEVNGHKIHVEKACFSVKGDYNPKLRKKLSNKQKKKIKLQQQKLFDWRPDALPGERKKSDKVVVIKNVFNPADFEKDPASIQEIRSDIRSESSKYGEVRKVTVYDRNPEGVTTVAFKEPEEADVCIEALNGRWFAGRQLSAETWDGKAKYDIKESEAEREARLKKWEKFLETGEGSETKAGGEGSDLKKEESKEKPEVSVSSKSSEGDAISVETDKRAMEVQESVSSS